VIANKHLGTESQSVAAFERPLAVWCDGFRQDPSTEQVRHATVFDIEVRGPAANTRFVFKYLLHDLFEANTF
jgi:hypothetical protein